MVLLTPRCHIVCFFTWSSTLYCIVSHNLAQTSRFMGVASNLKSLFESCCKRKKNDDMLPYMHICMGRISKKQQSAGCVAIHSCSWPSVANLVRSFTHITVGRVYIYAAELRTLSPGNRMTTTVKLILPCVVCWLLYWSHVVVLLITTNISH